MEWRFIVAPDAVQNRYQISDTGVLRDIVRGRIVAQHMDSAGYIRTRLASSDGKERKYVVHRLVASTFLPAPEEGRTHVDHIDGNRANNCVSNLRWCTQLENNRNPGTVARQKASHPIVEASLKRKVLCENTGEVFVSMTEAAKHFGLTIWAVTQSCKKFRQGKPRRPMKFGKPVMHFRLIEEKPVEIKQDRSDTLQRALSKPNAKAVRCLETGLEYPSTASAARAYGLKVTTVRGSCNRHFAGCKQSKAFGTRQCYHFEWLNNKHETLQQGT